MRISFSIIRVIVAVFAVAVTLGNTSAQQVFYTWVAPTSVANWNVNTNWDDNGNMFVPDVDQVAGESALINNGRTAIVNQSYPTLPRIAELNLVSGTVQIEQNGKLEVVVSGAGIGRVTIGSAGSINLTGNGQLSTAGPVTSSGTLRLTGPNSGAQIGGDFVSEFGTIGANITNATNHGLINVTGAATIGGTLRVNMSGFVPTYGQSWNVVTANSLTGDFNETIVESSPVLGRGLQILGNTSGNNALVEVGNTLVLTVHRQSGATAIHNVIGDPINITSYAITSANGLLNPGGWTELSVSNQAGSGWVNANPTTNALTELNLEQSHSVLLNDTLMLGSPYAGAMALGSQEDVVFQYSTADGQLRTGIVEYLGIPNDLTLFIDPSNGSAAIGNLSPFVSPPMVTGYTIQSATNQLTLATWDSFSATGDAGPGWETANPTSSALSETNLENTTQFTNGKLVSIGEIFTINGSRDLTFEYTTLSGELLSGTVQYGAIPEPPAPVPGDYNGDGFVNAADYAVWRDALGSSVANGTGADGTGDGNVTASDYDYWKARFGTSAGSGSGAYSANVPEPSSAMLTLLGIAIAVAGRCWRRV